MIEAGGLCKNIHNSSTPHFTISGSTKNEG
jgi:hypothetical protein